VQAAIARFEVEAPDADLLRHLHVHFDAYLRGRGQAAERLSEPVDATGAIVMTERGLVYWLGGNCSSWRTSCKQRRSSLCDTGLLKLTGR
jgi:hypothetical protein